MYKNDLSFVMSKILGRLPAKRISDKFNIYRHQQIRKQLAPIFDEAYETFTRYDSHKENDTVWIFWWQGEDSMPKVVQKCYRSIQQNRGKKNIVLITQDNIKQYTDIPKLIYDKLDKGVITYTHFSDIVRANLIKNNGGLWMDATLYVTSSLDNIDLKKLFYCSGYPADTFNVSFGRWTGFFMGGPSGMDLFSFMDRLYEVYWRDHEKLLDYFLIDYGLDYAWKKDLSSFKSLEESYKQNNPHLFDLQGMLNQPYDDKEWERITSNTNVFKLSYKKKVDFDKKESYYSRL